MTALSQIVCILVSKKKARDLSEKIKSLIVLDASNTEDLMKAQQFPWIISKVPGFEEFPERQIVSFESQRLIQSRIETSRALEKVVKVPEYFAAHPKSLAKVKLEENLYVVKTDDSFGSPSTHKMLVTNEISKVKDFFEKSSADAVLFFQKFIDHDTFVYKVFVVGDDVSVYLRGSIDPVQGESGFDSQSDIFKRPYLGSVPEFDLAIIKNYAAAIEKELNLGLFGFDVVKSKSTNDLYVVDVNYFPSFKEVPDFEEKLVSWVSKKILSFSS
jgi:glutathione synthase/RimK-type ligase-like ATP-grasp enzyme